MLLASRSAVRSVAKCGGKRGGGGGGDGDGDAKGRRGAAAPASHETKTKGKAGGRPGVWQQSSPCAPLPFLSY